MLEARTTTAVRITHHSETDRIRALRSRSGKLPNNLRAGAPGSRAIYHAPSAAPTPTLIWPPESRGMHCAGPSISILHRRTGCKLPSWSSPSACATEFVAEKLLAASEYGRGPTSKSATVTGWKRVGNRYRMEEGEIEVDSIKPIGLPDITGELARKSGFLGIVDLLKVAKHGKCENIYLIRLRYVRPRGKRSGQREPA